MFYVYLIQSLRDKKYYIGQTNKPEERIREHNLGNVESTKSRIPFQLVGYEQYNSRNEARWREYNLKKSAWQRKKFIDNLKNKK